MQYKQYLLCIDQVTFRTIQQIFLVGKCYKNVFDFYNMIEWVSVRFGQNFWPNQTFFLLDSATDRIVEFQNIVFSQQIIFWPRFFLNAIRRINETRKNKFNDSIFYSTVSIIC